MADFCWDCLADEIYPDHPERNDMAGLCKEGEMVKPVVCPRCARYKGLRWVFGVWKCFSCGMVVSDGR